MLNAARTKTLAKANRTTLMIRFRMTSGSVYFKGLALGGFNSAPTSFLAAILSLIQTAGEQFVLTAGRFDRNRSSIMLKLL